MLKEIWLKLYGHRASNSTESLSVASKATGVPASTIAYHDKRREKRAEISGTSHWDTEEGQQFLKRMIISLIYTFMIKGGIGAGRVREHLSQLKLDRIMGVSESSLYRLVDKICVGILKYKELQEQKLSELGAEELQELKVVLGIDETWLEDMLLVCQDLISGYLFLKSRVSKEIHLAGGS